MEINVAYGDITTQDVDAIVVNLFQDVTNPCGATGSVDQALGGAISLLIADGETTGKKEEITLIHTLGKMAPTRVVVAGLGKQKELDPDVVRSMTGEVLRRLSRIGVKKVATIAHGAGIAGMDTVTSGQSIAEGATLGLYRFDKYKSNKDQSTEIEEVSIVEHDADKTPHLVQGVAEGTLLGEATNLCRDMGNEPGNYMTPTKMSEVALEVANEASLELEVLDRPRLRDIGLGAFLGVAQGSSEPPKLIILRYLGDPSNDTNSLGLLGKGITFDSGGISIKPASRMGEMKGDMAGGATVIAAMKAIGKLKPKINVTAIVPATENMPSGSAQRPGDVIRTMSGKTVEIDNTDAEGRLVLADAMSYARSLGLERLIDIATLTGAMSVALGVQATGAFGNDQELMDAVAEAARQTGERIWPMPTFDEYKSQFASDVADIKNTGGRAAGSITGAQFIGEFADGASWIHLDIAGTSRTNRTSGYNTKGATGVHVRTLVRLVQDLAD